MDLSLHKVTVLPSSFLPGGIYLETSKGLVYLAVSSSEKLCMSGAKDAALSGSTLTITKFDDTKVTVDIATLAKNALSEALNLKLNIGTSGDASSTQSYYGLLKKMEEVQASVSAVYKPKGSKTVAELKSLSGISVGDVYNVTDSGEIEEGLTVRAGDNVAALKAGNGSDAGMWDVLAGIVDLSNYVTLEELAEQLAGKVDKTTTVNGKALSGNIQLGGEDITVGGASGQFGKNIDKAMEDLESQIEDAGKMEWGTWEE